VTRFTHDPLGMQVLHILISTSAVIVFLRNAPFPWFFKSLFIFGYFMLFEYNLISRNYILGVLFLFIACSLFKYRQKKFVQLCFFLALAANVHLTFAVISGAVFLTLLFENFRNAQLFSSRKFNIGYMIFITGSIMMLLQVVVPGDLAFFEHVKETPFDEKFTKGFISLFKGLLTIPDFTNIHFWNSNLLVNYSKAFSAIVGLSLYVVPLVLFKKNLKTLFFVYSALLGTQIFFFITQIGATRYDGITYIIFILALWIDPYLLEKPNVRASFLKNILVYGILLIQFFSGITAYVMDFKYPFSGSETTYEYLNEHRLDKKMIISASCEGTSVSPYLGKKVWFLCSGSFQSFCDWNSRCLNDISSENIIALLSDLKLKDNDSAVCMLNDSIPMTMKSGVWMQIDSVTKIRSLTKFDNNIVRQSNYYIYEIVKKDTVH